MTEAAVQISPSHSTSTLLHSLFSKREREKERRERERERGERERERERERREREREREKLRFKLHPVTVPLLLLHSLSFP